MGNLLAIHATNENLWADPTSQDSDVFQLFLTNALTNFEDSQFSSGETNLKRACCIGLMKEDKGMIMQQKFKGLMIPIANPIKLTSLENNEIPYSPDDTTNIIDKLDRKVKSALKGPDFIPLKRVSYAYLERKNVCAIHNKDYIGAQTYKDTSNRDVCDDFYKGFCGQNVSDCIDENGQYKLNDINCTNRNNGKILFPLSDSPLDSYAAHIWPEDCSCMNSLYGENYRSNLSLAMEELSEYTSGLVYFHNPYIGDNTCSKRNNNFEAYLTSTDAQTVEKLPSNFCVNLIDLNNVQANKILLKNVMLVNSCGSNVDTMEIELDLNENENNGNSDVNVWLIAGFILFCIVLCIFVLGIISMDNNNNINNINNN